jgi:hypothetical protein
MQLSKDKRQETLIYLVLWGLLFAAPVMSLYIRTVNTPGQSFDWSEVFVVWRQFGLFFIIFLVHNHLLAPLLVYRQRKLLYFSIVAVVIALFAVYQCNTGPDDRPRRGPRHEMAEGHRPPEMRDGHRPPEMRDGHRPPMFDDGRPLERPPHKPDGKRPPFLLNPHDLTAIVVLVLMLFANLGIKLYFKQRRDQLQMTKLEKQNLEQQLQYLKYQLNPHFLMNTLNNIHALVDIDGERAKETIIELSKILRYVLYESNRERVPMAKEAEFMENYTRLMRIRYTDRLRFTVSQPDDIGGIVVPPLLFISFVENAFKHGVSYQQDSYIDISCQRLKGKGGEDRLLWSCRNSKHPKPDTDTGSPRQGGVGLANVRQRLDLIYGDNYTLSVNDDEKKYEVILDIPVEA